MEDIKVFEGDVQRTWDATSLSTLDACPQKYKLRCVDGWTTDAEKADLTFGHLYGLGLDTFYKSIVENGAPHDIAVRQGVRAILEASWDFCLGQPKTGSYVRVWRCTGSTKYKNDKGNAAKCPWSHKGKLWITTYMPDPITCSCGSPTEQSDYWAPEHPVKDRVQAVKAFVWYTEEQKGGALQIASLSYGPDGKERHTVLSEMGWRVPLWEIDGVEYHASGWFDTVKRLDETEETYVCDFKSSKNALTNTYFAQYRPNHQVELYNIAGAKVLDPALNFGGVAIEAMQVLKEGIRFAFRIFPSSVAHAQEYLEDAGNLIVQAIQFTKTGYWPRRRSSCYLCEFKKVCAAEPAAREAILKEHFVQRWWNPLKRVQQETRP